MAVIASLTTQWEGERLDCRHSRALRPSLGRRRSLEGGGSKALLEFRLLSSPLLESGVRGNAREGLIIPGGGEAGCGGRLGCHPCLIENGLQFATPGDEARLPPGDGAELPVRQAIGRCEKTGSWDVAGVARDLHVSARTLLRSLQAEGITFHAELDRRRLRTKELLLRPQTSLSEIAFALGFSEVSALVRAFKKWEGVTPGAYRTGQGLRN